jgi:hypothetical protein
LVTLVTGITIPILWLMSGFGLGADSGDGPRERATVWSGAGGRGFIMAARTRADPAG